MSKGFVVTTMVGARVLGQLTYVPAHIGKDGKLINQKVEIPVRVNGKSDRKDDFKITVWSKLADTMCRSCSPGKELHIHAEPRTYLGTLFNADGTPRYDNAGQVIQIKKTSYNCLFAPRFGQESLKQIQKEIDSGHRPRHWNVKNHPDWNLWLDMLNQRHATVWDGQSNTFLFARVFVPQGVQVDLTACKPGNVKQADAAGGAPINPNAIPAAGTEVPIIAEQSSPSTPSMVQHAVNTAAANNVRYVDQNGNPCDAQGNPLPAQQPQVVQTAAPTAPTAPQGGQQFQVGPGGFATLV